MKTNETNKLDEILYTLRNEIVGGLFGELSVKEKKEVEVSVEKAKQQINKWALEKCLEVIGENIKIDEKDLVQKYFSPTYNMLLETLRERARKEFYE